MTSTPWSRAERSLEGLSVGDAFGERFFGPAQDVEPLIASRTVPEGPWGFTDDTAQALALCACLRDTGGAAPDDLAPRLAANYLRGPDRGYGAGARQMLDAIGHGTLPWRLVSQAAFEGMGSRGNGAAMRAAPLGAYFADDVPALVAQAFGSAQPTHAHPDGQLGAVAVALAAAHAVRVGDGRAKDAPEALFRFVLDHLPGGETTQGIARAASLPPSASVELARAALGTGAQVLSSDTVPFVIWAASRHLRSYEEALWLTVAGLGDRDTTCAMVGGIVALSCADGVPAAWLARREPLAGWL
jgi:ADP-ribosylglycohydrolase